MSLVLYRFSHPYKMIACPLLLGHARRLRNPVDSLDWESTLNWEFCFDFFLTAGAESS